MTDVLGSIGEAFHMPITSLKDEVVWNGEAIWTEGPAKIVEPTKIED
jgi:hypothetical protein